jgi:hypothetical protein
MAAEEASEAISSLGKSITSPAKLIFVRYVLLAYKEIIHTSRWQFIAVASVFFLAQVLHDDYLRIRLNAWAQNNWPFISLGRRP